MFEEVSSQSPDALAPALADLDSSSMSDAALIDAIVDAERLASFAAARQAQLISELATRRMEDAGGGEFVVDEIGTALQLSRVAANRRLGFALDLARLPATAHALALGVIDVSRARALADATACLPDELAHNRGQALPERRSRRRSAAQQLRRAVLSADRPPPSSGTSSKSPLAGSAASAAGRDGRALGAPPSRPGRRGLRRPRSLRPRRWSGSPLGIDVRRRCTGRAGDQPAPVPGEAEAGECDRHVRSSGHGSGHHPARHLREPGGCLDAVDSG
jgi:hypothetical protein